jgi:hypothetical protein
MQALPKDGGDLQWLATVRLGALLIDSSRNTHLFKVKVLGDHLPATSSVMQAKASNN